jgi:hypothetical protein
VAAYPLPAHVTPFTVPNLLRRMGRDEQLGLPTERRSALAHAARFPQARQRPDLWHADEHLWEVAHDRYGRGSPKRGPGSARASRPGKVGNRHRLEENVIENHGLKRDVAGIRIRGETRDLVLVKNQLRDTRPASERRQTIGVEVEEHAGPVALEGNSIEAKVKVKDQRATSVPK